ncbi:hypothetical protein CALVIDRAFT_126520 [Calocera viscosa TUFC12733]|uniref:Uncharacterized protein n=1 Tax=Calocera viscosa (strain TUFC12733) TaxID=1330018 RepID=A0A167RR37_CALVF|nr:hypothetical protein CALVIDRAFT_126520 [Calocera viscosa TUFC12733]
MRRQSVDKARLVHISVRRSSTIPFWTSIVMFYGIVATPLARATVIVTVVVVSVITGSRMGADLGNENATITLREVSTRR